MEINEEKLIKETVKNGGVLALLYFDVHGTDSEKIKEFSTGFIKRMLSEPGIVYVKGEIDEPIQDKDVVSTAIEVKLLAKSMPALVNFVGKYNPFSVEILEPEEIKISMADAHELLMSVSTMMFENKKYILERVAKKEDLERIKKELENRIKLGRMLLEKSRKKG
ncbi:MAG: hypothetical protein QXY05_00015 [Candidatus Anstonellales archaeon]